MSDYPPYEPPVDAEAGGAPVFTLSSWGKRVLGTIIDSLLYVPLYIIFLVLIGHSSLLLGYLLYAVTAIALWLYLMYDQGTTGQTIGKRAAGIKLVREADAQVIGFGLSIGRHFVHFLDSVACGVGYLNPLWDEKRQTFADKLLNTVVIDDKR